MTIEVTQRSSRGKVLLAVNGMEAESWQTELEKRRDVVLAADTNGDPSIHYAVAWHPPAGLLSSLPGLKAIFSLGAGVDHLLAQPSLPDVPIVRVVDQNLTAHMSEYVCWRVLDHHRQGRIYSELKASKIWNLRPQSVAATLQIGIMGLGELGRAAADKLSYLGFRVAGWSRTPKTLPAIETFHGSEGLRSFLARTDILVVLLPLTADTDGIIDHALLSQLRRGGPLGGPVLINAGRGRLQREAEILRALEDGTLYEASLDVFENEPLPADSPLWSHPRVFITPHGAADSEPAHLVPSMLDQMDAHDRGEPLRNVVDRSQGY